MTRIRHEARYLEIGGALGYVEEVYADEAPAVLCLHTAGQSGVQWRRTSEELAALGYRVIVPDLPGHGRSEPAPSGPVEDLSQYADWCQLLMSALKLERPYVVGCSIGGKIALDLAVRAGDEPAGAVVLAAEAGPGRVNVAGLRRELQDLAAPSRSDRTYLGTLAVVGSAAPPATAELIATMHRREDPAVSSADLIGWGTHDVRDALGSARCPVQLVAGEDDLWLDPEQVRRTAQALPHGRHVLLPGVGHYPMEEIDGFARLLHGWLRQLSGDRVAGSVSPTAR
ncbi:alpha/beta fold hydrolase [Streptomyces endophyticus]|uniref:Alpha/beta hydrolase n=1 Tax=Streptomyces endophyticus TaxID=714166 RepID=A0ABU6EZJ9_9ACTN|nr:alpha/beta hydrolase [Streptomyces endophyticus]MEB8337188.1 alpha/beta hydrolase [Streptomyces endophyticus]